MTKIITDIKSLYQPNKFSYFSHDHREELLVISDQDLAIISIEVAIGEEEVAVTHVTTNVDLATEADEEEAMVVDIGAMRMITKNWNMDMKDQETVVLEDFEGQDQEAEVKVTGEIMMTGDIMRVGETMKTWETMMTGDIMRVGESMKTRETMMTGEIVIMGENKIKGEMIIEEKNKKGMIKEEMDESSKGGMIKEEVSKGEMFMEEEEDIIGMIKEEASKGEMLMEEEEDKDIIGMTRGNIEVAKTTILIESNSIIMNSGDLAIIIMDLEDHIQEAT